MDLNRLSLPTIAFAVATVTSVAASNAAPVKLPSDAPSSADQCIVEVYKISGHAGGVSLSTIPVTSEKACFELATILTAKMSDSAVAIPMKDGRPVGRTWKCKSELAFSGSYVECASTDNNSITMDIHMK